MCKNGFFPIFEIAKNVFLYFWKCQKMCFCPTKIGFFRNFNSLWSTGLLSSANNKGVLSLELLLPKSGGEEGDFNEVPRRLSSTSLESIWFSKDLAWMKKKNTLEKQD